MNIGHWDSPPSNEPRETPRAAPTSIAMSTAASAPQDRMSRLGLLLERLAHVISAWTATSAAFAIAAGALIIWAATGPVFHFSDTWQLVVNTGTTVITFLMVFLIQRAQNKDSRAIHLKLNEIVAVLEGASNRLINVEDLTEAEVHALHERYQQLLVVAQAERGNTRSHSIEEAEPKHSVIVGPGESTR